MTVTNNCLIRNGCKGTVTDNCLIRNSCLKRPLPKYLIGNGLCGGEVGLGPARIIGNARCLAPITYLDLCNELQAPVTNAVLPI